MHVLNRWLAVLTFPGIVVHELGHRACADLAGARVEKVKYFGLRDPAGFVVCDAKRVRQSALVAVGPLLLGTVVAAVAFAYASISSPGTLAWWFWAWVGFSAALHALPSRGDARALHERTKARVQESRASVAGYPAAGSVYVLGAMSAAGAGFLYAALLFSLFAL